MAHRTIFPLLGEGGGGGSTAWGQITGRLSNQTDLQEALNAKASSSDIPTATSDLTNDSGFITISDVPAQIQSNWNESDTTSPAYIVGKPAIPTVNDSTITFEDSEGTTIDSFTLNQSSNKTITIPSGGGGNAWYGSMEQLEAIPQEELDPDRDYFVTDRLDYSEIANTPLIPSRTSQLENDSDYVQGYRLYNEVRTAMDYLEAKDVWLTQAEYDALSLAGELNEGTNYHIENNVDTVQMEVTFTDQTTATYNVYIQPSN